MEPSSGAARPPWRLAAAALAMCALGATAWLVWSRGAAERAPEALFYDLRDRVLEGDGAAPWREMLPRARLDYAAFVRKMGRSDEPGAAKWRAYVGLSKEDLLTLPPETVMAREHAAGAGDFFRGARVHRVDRWDETTALLRITTRAGESRNWVVKRVDGAWKLDNLWPMATEKGVVMARPGEAPREGTVPLEGDVPPGPR